jgi:hypothetical protein
MRFQIFNHIPCRLQPSEMVSKPDRQEMLWFCSFKFPYVFMLLVIGWVNNVAFVSLFYHSAVLFALMRKEPKGSRQKQLLRCFCRAHAQGNTPLL